MTSIEFNKIKAELLKVAHLRGTYLQKWTVEVLDKHVPYYNWTGLYWMNDLKGQLELGAYVGEATDHTGREDDQTRP